MASRILRTDHDREAWANFLGAQPLPMTVSAVKGAKRSIPQNSTAAKWYSEIGAEIGEPAFVVKAMCKLQFGLLIMERDNPSWVGRWHALYAPLPYAMRLRLFEALPVTREFTTKQMAEYMDGVQKYYSAQGIALTDPEALKYVGER